MYRAVAPPGQENKIVANDNAKNILGQDRMQKLLDLRAKRGESLVKLKEIKEGMYFRLYFL